MALSTPCYPPGVLQTVTIPDPTSLDGFGELEITMIPSRTVTDINHISAEGIATFKEMLYEADEEYRRKLLSEMNSTITLLEAIRIRDESIWDDNAFAVGGPQPPLWFEQDCEYGLPVPWAIRIALEEAEEDADYEEWINSKQYVKSLEEHNRHKLLAWNKEKAGKHPKWSGEYIGITRSSGWARADYLGSIIIKERYRMFVDVDEMGVFHGKFYAKGSTPYGDVYIPEKIANHLKDDCGAYDMDIALQDVEGPPGKKPNSFRWTCVYLHNKGYAVE